jgi:polysaccharide deacetylase 2 family uncharacterized protein YibQ
MSRRVTGAFCLSLVSTVWVTLALWVIVLEGHRPLPSLPVGPSSPPRRPSGPPVVYLPESSERPRSDGHSPGPGRMPSSGAPVVWVMDDMGRDAVTAETVLQWPPFVSIAVLPDGAVAERLGREACRQGRDVLIHLPMTSIRPDADPGPMAVSTSMAASDVYRILAHARRILPCAKGLNQHMGSRASQEFPTMVRVVQAGQSLGLRFFIDSRTAARSYLCDAADRFGIPCLRRTFFFDADASPEELPARWRQVVSRARWDSRPVVVIAHPYPATLAFLDRLFRSGTWRSVDWRRPSEVLPAGEAH